MKKYLIIVLYIILCQSFVSAQSVNFFWSGAVTNNSFVVKAQVSTHNINTRLVYSDDSLFSNYLVSISQLSTIQNNNIVQFKIENLLPNQQYYYRFSYNNSVDSTVFGKCMTFSSDIDTFTIALGSCSWTGSAHPVFETIRLKNPLLFLHMGDMHYENIGVNNVAIFQQAFQRVLNSATQSKLYEQIPIAYMWDDHDYGPNNSDSTSPSREAARFTYRQYVPHYPLVEEEINQAIYHSFSIGRVKFIMCDSRSARSPANSVDDENKTMLGATQKAWFKQELIDGRDNYALTVWVNTLPWIGVTGDDGWYLYTNERKELSNFIKNNNIQNLCMVSGDAHMIAVDDGTNSNYSDSSGKGFPVLHAASLHRTPGIKGGPYSHGAFPGIGQFATMHVTDSGDSILVNWKGLTYLNELLVEYSFSYPINSLSQQSVIFSVDTLYSYKSFPDRPEEIEIGGIKHRRRMCYERGNYHTSWEAWIAEPHFSIVDSVQFNQSYNASEVDFSSLKINNVAPLSVNVENDSSLFQDSYLRVVISYDDLVSDLLPFYNSSQTNLQITGTYFDGSFWSKRYGIALEGNLIGDLNYDRMFDIQDIMLLVNFIFYNMTPNDVKIGDINFDNLVDISDLVTLVEDIY